MGIFVTARKIEENDEYVIYACGKSPECLNAKFRIDKDALECRSIDAQSNIVSKDIVTIFNSEHKGCCLAIFGKILSYHKENNVFPDKITKQS